MNYGCGGRMLLEIVLSKFWKYYLGVFGLVVASGISEVNKRIIWLFGEEFYLEKEKKQKVFQELITAYIILSSDEGGQDTCVLWNSVMKASFAY